MNLTEDINNKTLYSSDDTMKKTDDRPFPSDICSIVYGKLPTKEQRRLIRDKSLSIYSNVFSI
jgi:hypothetical protein